MTHTTKELNYREFFRNFQRYERGELNLNEVEQLSVHERQRPFSLYQWLRHFSRRFRFPTPSEYYRGGRRRGST